MPTDIQWTNETWNPIAGCSKISDGCKNCYAIKDAVRLSGNNNPKIAEKYAGTTQNGNNWTGKINLGSDDVLTQPMRWTRPRMIFVNSMSDLFHENVPDEWIDKIFAVIALSPQHTFQILTKRADRMRDYLNNLKSINVEVAMTFLNLSPLELGKRWIEPILPLSNVWLGVSVENQKAADERIPLLLEAPAAVRWLSCEPLLENVDLTRLNETMFTNGQDALTGKRDFSTFSPPKLTNKIDWVVVGGESGGIRARQCSVDWIRAIVDQCKSAQVPVFVKQLGEWAFEGWKHEQKPVKVYNADGKKAFPFLNFEKSKKGGDLSEMPEDLRIREFPL